MATKPGKKLKSLVSIFSLLAVLPSQSQANGTFYREFLSDKGIVSVSGEKIDDHHARISGIQIAHDHYREIRVLNPNTGATEVLQFTDPNLEVTYTLPLHGKFLKLQIKRREKDGIRTADLILSHDGSRYIPVRNYIKKYQSFQQSRDLSTAPVCMMPRTSPLNEPDVGPAIDPFLNKPANVATSCLGESCKLPPFKAEYDSMISGLSDVVASRDSSTSKGDRFLSCLNQHNLNHISETIKGYFNDSLKSPSKPSVECELRDNGNSGEYFQTKKDDENQNYAQKGVTYFWSPCSYGACAIPGSDPADYYADTFFHETLHRVGIEKEAIVVDVVSCCGSKKDGNSASACQRIDQTVTQTNERNARIKASVDKLVGFDTFWAKIEKLTDEQRANTFYDDFFETLKSSGGTGGELLASCAKMSGKNQETCMQDFVSKTNDKITKYFDSPNCSANFKDKFKSDRSKICQSLKDDALKMLQTNVSNVCDSTKASAFEKSCLFAMMSEQRSLELAARGTVLADPDVIPDSPQDAEDKKARDAFLTAYAHQIPPLEKAYNEIKEKYDDDKTNSMLTAMLDLVGKTTNQFQSDYKTCLDKGKSKEQCANDIKNDFFHGKHGNEKYGLDHFFRRTCPTYFTRFQRSTKPCREIHEKLVKVFEESFAGGCKTEDKSKQIGVPGNDLTCLFAAINEGKYIYAHYDELSSGKKITDSSGRQINLIDSSGRPMTNATAQEAKTAAGEAAKGTGVQTKSFQIPDHANKQLAGRSSASPVSSARRSPASESGTASAFIPTDGFEDTLKNELDSPAQSILKAAGEFTGRAASHVIPNAEASTSDTSSLVVKAPQPISQYSTGIEGDMQATQGINTGSIDPYSAIGAASTSRTQSSSANRKSQDSVGGQTSAASDRSPASTTSSSSAGSKSAKSANAKSSATNGSKTAASGAGSSQSSAAGSSSDDLLSRQKHILELFKNNPALALKKIKNESIRDELVSDQIEAKDDLGKPHGSDSPTIKIWYDVPTKKFLGFPEP